jgi:phage anti-repressor protein
MTQQKQKIQPSHARGSLVQSPDLPIIKQGENIYVSAILLHKKLYSKQEFSNWIKRRISNYGFELGVDFLTSLSKSTGGRQATDYILSLDTAKEMAMLENTAIGRQIRRYFIEKEKELRGISHLPGEPALFRGLDATSINGRSLYPYREILLRCGYKASSNRRYRYAAHFVLQGNILLITKEFALHLYHQRRVYNNRKALIYMQPVLPLNFTEPAKVGGANG